jgi:hypothetical protein
VSSPQYKSHSISNILLNDNVAAQNTQNTREKNNSRRMDVFQLSWSSCFCRLMWNCCLVCDYHSNIGCRRSVIIRDKQSSPDLLQHKNRLPGIGNKHPFLEIPKQMRQPNRPIQSVGIPFEEVTGNFVRSRVHFDIHRNCNRGQPGVLGDAWGIFI